MIVNLQKNSGFSNIFQIVITFPNFFEIYLKKPTLEKL